MRGRPIPPGSGREPGQKRHPKCGTSYNGYVWGTCPQCKADEEGMFALRCIDCRNPYFSAEREDPCPECGSGNTTVFATPG